MNILKKKFHKIRKYNNVFSHIAIFIKNQIWSIVNRIRRFFFNEFVVFLDDNAIAINKARLDHLASLDLDISHKTVLEVGAGIGMLTHFFEDRFCDVLSTDSRPENIKEIKRKKFYRKARILDLEKNFSPDDIGYFDVVFCYGLLYHLSDPDLALKCMANVSREMIVLETQVRPGDTMEINKVPEEGGYYTMASSRVGCRPTRRFILEELKKYFGYAYITKSQPDHDDFEIDWLNPSKHGTFRSIFIGSKKALVNKNLLDYIPDKQERFKV